MSGASSGGHNHAYTKPREIAVAEPGRPLRRLPYLQPAHDVDYVVAEPGQAYQVTVRNNRAYPVSAELWIDGQKIQWLALPAGTSKTVSTAPVSVDASVDSYCVQHKQMTFCKPDTIDAAASQFNPAWLEAQGVITVPFWKVRIENKTNTEFYGEQCKAPLPETVQLFDKASEKVPESAKKTHSAVTETGADAGLKVLPKFKDRHGTVDVWFNIKKIGTRKIYLVDHLSYEQNRKGVMGALKIDAAGRTEDGLRVKVVRKREVKAAVPAAMASAAPLDLTDEDDPAVEALTTKPNVLRELYEEHRRIKHNRDDDEDEDLDSDDDEAREGIDSDFALFVQQRKRQRTAEGAGAAAAVGSSASG
ncbi:unnamed protein product [Vitrella brassicaformis CCMP3155]|uniref:Uncharacterized protein n=1 Tax=Vitrella brassicaformis (strain CCMP3155) TaxID=1169540 RepID=A0A0G4ELL4_VITBC|nr:unnamed protein product [Vitrella brassicaformis CCMP3155]|eukprot:CEL98313.1 unnamed protein product [Vitrella brassicaformis CCMP3155]